MAAVEHERIPAVRTRSPLRTLAAWFDPGEPHPYRGPFTRWPRTADAVLAIGVFAASLIAVSVSVIDDNQDFTLASVGDQPAGAIMLLAVAATALWWRRAHSIGATAVVLVVMLGWAVAGYGDGQDLALVVAAYSVGRYTTSHEHNLAAVVAIASVSIVGSLIDANQRIDVAPLIVAVLPWYVGRLIRNRSDYLVLLQERAVRLEAEQQARAREAVAEERSRIARELHDVVAHQVSMMTVQAGAAKTVAREDLDSAIEAMGDVERAGRQALGELRHLLGVLRPDSADSDQLGPQPGLSDIPALVNELAHTGADVTLSLTDLPDHTSAAVDLSAYRIVQESLTNIIKHAGPAPTVEIAVALDDNTLAIDITNTVGATSPSLPASGYGIAGMRERAALLGGILTASPQPPNHYGVHARLPLESEPT